LYYCYNFFNNFHDIIFSNNSILDQKKG